MAAVADQLRPVLTQLGITRPIQLAPMPGGANNRVFRLTHASGELVVKSYFQNPGDPRDRFGAERAFYELLTAHGISGMPQPIGWVPEHRLGLFECLCGRKLDPEEVNRSAVDQALAFITELNQCRAEATRFAMPVASEACFSMAEHLAAIERRVTRLLDLEVASDVDRAALAFVNEELLPSWHILQTRIQEQASSSAAEPLPRARWCLSPSDFGFHNALLTTSGRLRFFDFEYAGWDDPAKLVCDFFCQPQLPVAIAEWDHVVGTLTQALGAADNLPDRAAWLLPAYRIKWCCIMLNDFHRPSRARRDFAGLGDRKAAQLTKARLALQAVTQPSSCRTR